MSRINDVVQWPIQCQKRKHFVANVAAVIVGIAAAVDSQNAVDSSRKKGLRSGILKYAGRA